MGSPASHITTFAGNSYTITLIPRNCLVHNLCKMCKPFIKMSVDLSIAIASRILNNKKKSKNNSLCMTNEIP